MWRGVYVPGGLPGGHRRIYEAGFSEQVFWRRLGERNVLLKQEKGCVFARKGRDSRWRGGTLAYLYHPAQGHAMAGSEGAVCGDAGKTDAKENLVGGLALEHTWILKVGPRGDLGR